MKAIVVIIIIITTLFLITSCLPTMPDSEIAEELEDEIEELLEGPCDDFTGDHLIMCEAALIYEDLSMCELVVGRFHEECIITVAETIYDPNQVDDCEISNVEDHKIMCEALIMEDIDLCFNYGQGEGLGTSLNVRDCIDLVSRKMRDVELCEYFESHQSEGFTICGDTGDCEGQWLELLSIEDHVDSCQYAVETAIEYDTEN